MIFFYRDKIFFILKILIFVMLFSSCIQQKRLRYLQDKDSDTVLNGLTKTKKTAHKIKPYDELYIKVLTFNEKMSNFFNSSQSGNGQSMQSEASMSLISYAVDEQGNIVLPILGEIYVENLSLKETKAKIQKKLDEYLDKSELIVKLINNKITILGEVKRPGQFVIYKDQINLFEALGMAGDMTPYGNRKRVTLIREIDNVTNFRYLNISDKKIIESKYFLLQPNDIIYIEPLNAKSWTGAVFNYSTILSTVSTLITILYFINRY